jgi:crossover junction endodeoxyribonuclease RusA
MRKTKSGDPVVRVYEAGTAESWKSDIAQALQPHIPSTPIESGASVRLKFSFKRPKSHYGTGKNSSQLKPSAPGTWHCQRPDCDNLAKVVLDVIKSIGIIRDDGVVFELHVSKIWDSHSSGVLINIRWEEGQSER